MKKATKRNLGTKVLSLLLVGVMMLGLIACSNSTSGKTTEAPEASTSGQPDATQGTEGDQSTEGEDPKVTYPLDTDVELVVYTGSHAPLNAEYDSYEKSYWHSHVSEVVGVKTTFLPKVPAAQREMMYADPDQAPDIFLQTYYNGLTGYKKLVDDGVALELTDYLEQYAPNYWEYIHRPENAEFLKQITDDEGRHYMIASKRESDFNVTYMGPMIRKDWLDECGLDVPVTLEDFENVLVKFKEKYGATLGGVYSDFKAAGFASGTGAAAELNPSWVVRDGKVVFECLSPEWQEYVEVLADWMSKGLIDGDFFTADRNVLRQKVAEGKVGVTVTAMSQLTTYIEDAQKAGSGAEWIGIEYARTAAGVPTTVIQTSPEWEDSVATIVSGFIEEEKIPVALAWIDYFYTEEGILFSNMGIEGETYTMVDGKPQFTELVTGDPSGMDRAVTKYGAWNSTFTGIQMEDFLRAKNVNTPVVIEAVDAWIKNTEASKYVLPKLFMTDDESQVYTDAWTAISTYAAEEIAKFINGEKAIDWNTFKKDIEGMGIQRCIDIQNAAYARYNAK